MSCDDFGDQRRESLSMGNFTFQCDVEKRPRAMHWLHDGSMEAWSVSTDQLRQYVQEAALFNRWRPWMHAALYAAGYWLNL